MPKQENKPQKKCPQENFFFFFFTFLTEQNLKAIQLSQTQQTPQPYSVFNSFQLVYQSLNQRLKLCGSYH